MKNNPPLVSVIIPTYNYGHFIPFALESLLLQTYPRECMEIIVVDDGSTDDTCEVVKKYDEKIRYIYQENKGVAGAINTGIANAKGEIITFLDSDDIWHSSRIEKVAGEFINKSDAGIVYHLIELIDSDNATVYKNFCRAFGFKEGMKGWITEGILASEIFSGGSSFAYRKSILDTIYPVPDDVKRLVDYYIAVLSSCYAPAVFIPEVLGKYRLHGKNISLLAARTDDKEAAVVNRHAAYTREKVIGKLLSMHMNIRQKYLDKVKRVQAKEMIMYYTLSGQRLKGMQHLPRLFRGELTVYEFLRGLALGIMSLCIPLSSFHRFETLAGNAKRSIRLKLQKINRK